MLKEKRQTRNKVQKTRPTTDFKNKSADRSVSRFLPIAVKLYNYHDMFGKSEPTGASRKNKIYTFVVTHFCHPSF